MHNSGLDELPLTYGDFIPDGIRKIVRLIFDQFDIPAIFVLEGGYNIDYLGENVKVTLEEMLASHP